MPRLVEMPHKNEASTNRALAAKYSRTSPIRRASQPVSGIATALATPKKVITQVPCDTATPRLPAMVESATLAMVESSTVMAVSTAMPTVAVTSGPPRSGSSVAGWFIIRPEAKAEGSSGYWQR